MPLSILRLFDSMRSIGKWFSMSRGISMASGLIAATPKGNKFFWNIDAKVGVNAPNRSVDVQLVQLGYRAVFKSPFNAGRLTPAEVDAYINIQPGAICSGREDDPLVQAIRAHEQSRGGTQDGVVSPLGQGHIVYTDAAGPHALILVALNNSLKDMLGDAYPHIEKHPECPGELRSLAELMFSK
jgi:hypothetical protein